MTAQKKLNPRMIAEETLHAAACPNMRETIFCCADAEVGWVEFFTRPNIGGSAKGLGLARGSTQPCQYRRITSVARIH
jgi:hypothetical protein